MKFFLAALPAFVVAYDLAITVSIVGTSLEGFTQLGGGVTCLNDDTVDESFLPRNGHMDFLSDSLEMCAIACNCRQGCISFNWAKPNGFDGSNIKFALPVESEGFGDQGKCTLLSSDCEGSFATAGGDAWVYAFQRTNKIATNVTATYPRPSSNADEKAVTNQVTCVLQSMPAADGFRVIGHGGPGAGICKTGGSLKELNAQAPANTGLAACKSLCAGDKLCKSINIKVDGSCKFRSQCCQTMWISDTYRIGWTSYAEESCAAPRSGVPTPLPRNDRDNDPDNDPSTSMSNKVGPMSFFVAAVIQLY